MAERSKRDAPSSYFFFFQGERQSRTAAEKYSGTGSNRRAYIPWLAHAIHAMIPSASKGTDSALDRTIRGPQTPLSS